MKLKDIDQGQYGFSNNGTSVWNRVFDGAICVCEIDAGGLDIMIYSKSQLSHVIDDITIDESARQVFIDYFTRKGK